jgi:hypothetical protein
MRRIAMSALVTLLLAPFFVRAEHADIVLKVFRVDPGSGNALDEANASSDQEPPAGGVKQRAAFKAKAREPLVLQFILVNTYPHGVNKNVTVRYFVVPVAKVGQKTLPELESCVMRGQFQMHFKPKCRVGARVAFTIPNPGNYLLRVDTLNTASDHEHFSALDVQVE